MPFLFSTGYGGRAGVPQTYGGVPVLEKPYDPGGLRRAMLEAFAADGAG